jgi:trigger factor
VEIGSGQLIPGFEDQLIGVKAGDEKVIEVTFPEDYGAKNLAGKPAQFALTITAVKTAGETMIDDEFAKRLGLTDLEQLKGLLKGQVEQQLNGLTRTHMKRKLLDQLAAGHDFPVPPSMVDAEFEQIWHQLVHETEHEADPAAAMAELESERDDYRRIAERRVRLGLLLSEIGTANGVEVTQQEMNRLIAQASQQYGPEDRQRFVQYVQQEPMAAAQLRAPLFEDKVVDFLFDKAEITDREVTKEELEAAIESDEGFSTGTHSHDHDNPKPRKKAVKPATEGGEEAAAKKPAAKKAKAVAAESAADGDAPVPVVAGDVEPAAPGDALVEAAPVKKAATRKAPAKKAAAGEAPVEAAGPETAEGEAGGEALAKPKKAPARKKAVEG